MGRAPCCEKMGMKKGPWTTEEDLILVNYINQNDHGNWRALPKRAGLLRCGKSCRLRWMNYLRPDIKRGNFTKEEENTIIKLHQELGNKWSVIAARLPGRTDNEIKNVWHTHLKKMLIEKSQPKLKPEAQIHSIKSSEFDHKVDNDDLEPHSPAHSSSDISSVTTTASASASAADADAGRPDDMISDSLDNFPEMDESFWSEVFPADDSSATSDFSAGNNDFQVQASMEKENLIGSDLYMESGMDFWYDLFNKAEELIELPQF